MKISEVTDLKELNYPGNIGVMEMAKFYQIASSEEKSQMKELLANKKTDEAWELLQHVAKTKLQDIRN